MLNKRIHMKNFGKLIKIVFISAIVTGPSFASGTGYNLDNQDNDTMEIIAGIGFTNPTKLTFTREAVDTILDARFDPSQGTDTQTRRAKTFLLGTVNRATGGLFSIGEPTEETKAEFLANFYSALEKTQSPIEVDIRAIEYNVSMYPTPSQTRKAGESFYFQIAPSTVKFRTSLVDEMGLPLFGPCTVMPTVTTVSATVRESHSDSDDEEALNAKRTETRLKIQQMHEEREAKPRAEAAATKTTYSDNDDKDGMGLFGDDD
jgi:hypothetical protein